jgi:pilus assembly protein CpaE
MRPTVVLVGEDSLALASLRQHLEKESRFLVQKKILGFPDAIDFLHKNSGPLLLVVDLNWELEKTFRAMEEVKRKFPEIRLILTSAESSPDTLLRALRAGAEEFLPQPFNWPEVIQAFDKIRERMTQLSTHTERQGHIITVFSTKGGVGTTTVATNLAVALAEQQRQSVCIVDLVLQFGAVTSFLGLEPSYTIFDLARNLQRIDTLMLEGSLVKHTSGVRVLAEPFQVEEASRVTAEDIDQILDVPVQTFDFVVLDTAKEFDETTFLALDRAQNILFVTEMNVPSLRNARRARGMSFERLRINRDKVRLVINRYEKSKMITLESVEKTLAIPAFWTLPNDYPTAVAALNQGAPMQEISPNTKLVKSYSGLAEALVHEFVASAPRQHNTEKKANFFSRWFSHRGADRRAG